MDKQLLVEEFIRQFVLKEKRDRAQLELSTLKRRADFSDRLNHQWDKVLDTNKLRSLPKVSDDYAYVKGVLRLSDTDKCYVISNYRDIDDQILEFERAFDACYGRGFATLIISASADRIYLETEEIGHMFRFTGHASGR